MATYYWVGGSGTWDSSNTANWSLTSGGAGGAGVPVADDSVIFNSASSGVSYVVQVSSSSGCGQITTSAPATGTLTFSNVNANDGYYFSAYASTITQTVNIHAACLFTPGASYPRGVLTVSNFGSTLTTITFNGSTTNSQTVFVSGSNSSGSINFCLSQTCTFYGVDLNCYNGAFTCTSSNITVNSTSIVSGGFYAGTFRVAGNGVTMTGTNLVVGSLTTPVYDSVYVDIGSYATTLNLATFNVTLNVPQNTYNPSVFYLGLYAVNNPTAMGNITFAGVSTQYPEIAANFSRASALTVQNMLVNVGTIYTYSTLNVTGAVAVSTSAGATYAGQFNMLGGFSTVSFGSTFTITGQVSGVVTANATISGTAGFASTVGVTDGTLYLRNFAVATVTGAVTLTRGSIDGDSGTSFTSGDITATGPTAAGYTFNKIDVPTLVCPSLTMTNTSLESQGSIGSGTGVTVNGGAGKTFSFTVNASAQAYGDYPCIRANSLTVTTPTMSITGTVTKRVICSETFNQGSRAVWTITPTPTLQYASFIRVQVNNGVSNYTGTSIGSDGLSVGVVAQAPRSIYCVAAGTQAFDAAIWATTPGGVGSVNNYPLPQDTIIFTTAIVGVGAITLTSNQTSLYIGSVTVEASTNPVSIAQDGGVGISTPYVKNHIFGNLYTSTTASSYIGVYISGPYGSNVVLMPSGNPTHYVSGNWWLSGNDANTALYIVGDSQSTVTYNLSGNLTTSNLRTGDPSVYGIDAANINTEGLVNLNAANAVIVAGFFNFSSTNIYITKEFYLTGSVDLTIADTPYTVTLVGAATATKYTNFPVGTYRGGTLILYDNAGLSYAYAYQLQGASVNRLIFSCPTTLGTRTITVFNGLTTKDFYTTGATRSWVLTASSNMSFVKDGGGRVQLTGNLTTTRVSASPANTWYVSGTLSQFGGATGWVQGTAPRNTGGFILF